MSHVCVERVIGALATDEGLRLEFSRSPRTVLLKLMRRGLELTECEQWSLARLDPDALTDFARAVDARLQRVVADGGEIR